jgi:hypothetical protein
VSVPNPDCTLLGDTGKFDGIARITYHFVWACVAVEDGVQFTRAILVDTVEAATAETLYR